MKLFCVSDKYAGSPRQKVLSWQTSLLFIVEELAGGGSMAVAVGIAVAVAMAVTVAVGVGVGLAVCFICLVLL